MKLEVLSYEDYDNARGNMLKCEDKWEDYEEQYLDEYLSISKRCATPNTSPSLVRLLEPTKAREYLAKGKVLPLPFNYMREKTNKPKCPLCGASITEPFFSISRVDNKTKICDDCGVREAFGNNIDMIEIMEKEME